MELTFSPATDQDAGVVYEFCKTLIEQYEDLSSIDLDAVLHWCQRKIQKQIGSFTCVRLNGVQAGFYHFSPRDGMMELDDLYILPEFRRRGIGTQIIQKCCAETGLPVMLYVFMKNTGAVALYQRLGFQITQTVGNSRYIMVRQPQEEL